MAFATSSVKTLMDGALPISGGEVSGNIEVQGNVNYNGNLTKASTTYTLDSTYPLLASADGSLSAPAYSYANDAGTGIYLALQTSVGISAKGVSVAIYSNENSSSESQVHPPVPLTGYTTVLSGQQYGNGTYVVRESSKYEYATINSWAIFRGTGGGTIYWGSAINKYNWFSSGGGYYTGSVTTNGYPGEYVEIELPIAIRLTGINLKVWNVLAFQVFGSNNGSTWDSLLLVNDSLANMMVASTIGITTTGYYRYYRVCVNRIYNNSSYTAIYAIDLYTVKTLPTLQTPQVGLRVDPTYKLHLGSNSAAKPSTTTWTVSSDERIKENITLADLDASYSNTKMICLKKYTWKDEVVAQGDDKSKLGWIAQDVEQIFPKAVDTVSMYGIQDCRTLNSDQLFASLFGTIQKLQARVEELTIKRQAQK